MKQINILFAALMPLVFSPTAASAEETKKQFGDWTLYCPQSNSMDGCQIGRTIASANLGNIEFTTYFEATAEKADDPKNQKFRMVAVGPVGLDPNSPPVIAMDGSVLGKMRSGNCSEEIGCIYEADVTKQFLDLIKEGKSELKILFMVAPSADATERSMRVDYSLDGFNDAMNAWAEMAKTAQPEAPTPEPAPSAKPRTAVPVLGLDL